MHPFRVHEKAGNNEEFLFRIRLHRGPKKIKNFSPPLLPSDKFSCYLGKFSWVSEGFSVGFLGSAPTAESKEARVITLASLLYFLS
jgi:hypothetical protein